MSSSDYELLWLVRINSDSYIIFRVKVITIGDSEEVCSQAITVLSALFNGLDDTSHVNADARNRIPYQLFNGKKWKVLCQWI